MKRQQHDAKLQFEYGLIARNDLLQVEVELSSARQELLSAEGKLQISRQKLARITGLHLDEESLIEDGLQPFKADDHNNSDSYHQELLENRSELNYLREQLSASKGSYLPRVDLSLVHEEYGNSLTPGDLPGSADNDNKLMLNARWNLFDGYATHSAVAAAGARTRAVSAELRDTEADMLLQLEDVLHNAHIAQGRLHEAKIAVTQAEENYRVTQNLFQYQQATTLNLIYSQLLLTRSKDQVINARYDLYLSAAALDRILERDAI